MACLEQHQAALSAECRAALPRLTQCANDVRALCDQGTDASELRQCVRKHLGQLQPDCRASLMAL
jgi:predicted component of type VI protein secretion system